MKKLTLALLMTLIASTSFAANEVPHTINFQSVLRDDGGNLIPDGPITLNFKILDADGTQLYQEAQSGEVVRGAVNVMIGEGDIPGSDAATGGIPLNALDPSHGEKFVQYQIGTNQPIDPISIGSIPYAMWAEKSFGVVDEGVTTESIKNGTIKAEDLEPGSVQFSDIGGLVGSRQLPADVVHLSELEAHKNDPRAHRSEQIQFTYLPGTTYLPPSSSSILSLQAVISSLYDSVNFVRTRLVSSMNEHSVQDIATAHPNGNFPTTRLQGQITNAQIADGAITASKLASGVVSAAALADNSIGSSKITDGTIRVEDIFQDASDPDSMDARYVNTDGDTMTRDLIVPDPIPPRGYPTSYRIGRTLGDHEERLRSLRAASPGMAVAFGSTNFAGILSTNYNIESVTASYYLCAPSGRECPQFRIVFSTPLQDENYVVVFPNANSIIKSSDSFTARYDIYGTVPTTIDFLVFHP